MRSESTETNDYGSFELIPEKEIAGQGVLFRPNAEQARAEILDELENGPQPVRLFIEKWPLRPNDMLVAKEYQKLLLELEAEQRIEVFNGKTGAAAPAATRRKYLGKPTIGQTYHLRLSR